MRGVKILGLMCLISFTPIVCSYATFVDEEKNSSYQALLTQSTYATKEQILDYFSELNLSEEAQGYGITGISIMFDERFPRPPHPLQTVNRGWVCLFERLQKVFSKEEQIREFNKTFKLHRSSLEKLDREFAQNISEMFCEACKKNAYLENGLELKD